MTNVVNDATLKQAGTIYQYLIALKDCFELNDGDILQIEINGDVSIINSTGGVFQKEVKHHFGDKNLSDRDVDFWKTLANWYVEFQRVKGFSHFILSTTATISKSSRFCGWNDLKKEEKLKRLIDIGQDEKEKEQNFRNQYNRIFNDSYSENNLLEILDKFIIQSSQVSLVGISGEFSKYIGHIPKENRDAYIGDILGEIMLKVKDPPHRWEVTKEAFEQILQVQSIAHGAKDTVHFPKDYENETVPREEIASLEQKKFILSIREIKYDEMIPSAMSDYWKAEMTVEKYFKDNLMYLESLQSYEYELLEKMRYTRADSEISAEGVTVEEEIKLSKKLYNRVMQWDAKDFGSIIRNQGYFQRGVIHNIVDEKDFKWKVGREQDEYK